MADIPLELFTEILSLLPVQSLLRFRSISKSLRILIDSHNFINLRLKNSLNFNLILRYDSKIYQVDFPNLTTCVQLDSPLQLHNPNNIPPHYYHPNNTALIGSCNGLLCIFTNHGLIVFWNPNTRKHWVIPHPPNSSCYYDSLNPNLGFGFDPFTDDYKVVRISTFMGSSQFMHSELILFSSMTNSWKLLPSMPYVLCSVEVRMGVFFLHSIHWVVRSKFNDSPHLIVIAINLTLENFNEVPLPEIGGERFSIDVGVLGGCLSMLVNYCETNEIDVWVMKDYGSRDSWCKLFTLMKSCFSQPWNGSSIRFLSDLRPLGYSSDRKKVMFKVYQRQLCWYDLKSEQVSYVTGITNCYEAMICVGSLVQPPYLRTNQHMFKKRERRRIRNSRCSSCLWFWK